MHAVCQERHRAEYNARPDLQGHGHSRNGNDGEGAGFAGPLFILSKYVAVENERYPARPLCFSIFSCDPSTRRKTGHHLRNVRTMSMSS